MTYLPILRRVLILGAVVLAWCALGIAAYADEANCATYAEFSERLAEGYGETPLGSGLDKGGLATVEVWVSPDTGTWTLLAVDPARSRACLAGFGTGWSFGGPKLAGAPA